jgi:Family of unknown function (DUF6262)
MPADRAHRLAESARERHEETLRRARSALTAMAKDGKPVTICDLVREARVSRSWIYTQPEQRDEIEQLRRNRPASSLRPTPGTRASVESLRRRLELSHQVIAQLRKENSELRLALARAHGERRAAASTSGSLTAYDTLT